MDSTIPSTIDAAGRIVIPKPVREAAGFAPGTLLEVRLRDGRVEIERAARKVKLVKRGAVCVAVAAEPAEALSTKLVAETQKVLRDRHG